MSVSLNRRMFLGAVAGAATLASGVGLARAATAKPSPLRPSVRYGPPPGVARLNANENPYGPSPAALKALAEASAQGAYYVDDSALKLRTMIAEYHGLSPEYVTLSSGSSGGLVAAAVMAGQSGNILGPDLFWDTTARAIEQQALGEIVRTPKTADMGIDLDAMYAAIDDGIAMVQVTNPNNPTGLLLEPARMRDFCIKASKKALVLADEAYNELTEMPEQNSMIPLVRQGHRVIVARTFSKIYGMAGLRVGYLIAPPDIIASMERYGIGWYGLNQAGLAAAIASYEDRAFMDMSRARIREARDMVGEAIKASGLTALPSQTNFMFVDLGTIDAEAFRAAMAEHKVMIRGIYRDYTHWSRVSMGRLEDVQMYVDALPRVLDALA
ncbi:pyridoxal phosphate-dependent aminotransferase [Parahaliea aestuarii]|uniref:Histidinol-phosphate aminotransferase family protein n=1 Tax=Parahaliea aestuarii TaxID=1852021 RepID=A0A5C8ZNF7_9GAMM|nr:histidinol-phosphate transaminase [Parahaliea aestuarii]TXS89998.1 histidinol-phosphate aminotransferase family protein [Parahaliea aestuarii]